MKLKLAGKHATRYPYAEVDPEDYDRLSCWSWRAQPAGREYFAISRTINLPGGGTTTRSLGREVLELGDWDGFDVHHRDGNPMNNRRDNLQVVSRKEHVSLHRHELRVVGTCAKCGQDYQRDIHAPLAGRARYCSACALKARCHIKPTQCPVCATWFTSRHPRARYCSDPCRKGSDLFSEAV